MDPDDVPLFPCARGGNTREAVRYHFKKAVLKAKLPYGRGRHQISFHSLRHTGASIMANAGVSVDQIKEIGGWKDQRMVERYRHYSDETLRAALERLDAAIEGRVLQGMTPASDGQDSHSEGPVN